MFSDGDVNEGCDHDVTFLLKTSGKLSICLMTPYIAQVEKEIAQSTEN